MAKPVLISLDVADQLCMYLQSTGMSEDLHSQGDLWPLITLPQVQDAIFCNLCCLFILKTNKSLGYYYCYYYYYYHHHCRLCYYSAFHHSTTRCLFLLSLWVCRTGSSNFGWSLREVPLYAWHQVKETARKCSSPQLC